MVERIMHALQRQTNPQMNCFYLCWADKTAVWAKELPPASSLAFQKLVNWPAFQTKVTLAADVLGDESVGPWPTGLSGSGSNVSFLKSHLQKSIRRSNPYKTIKTASELLKADLGEFLRRILIIALEDSLPLDGYAMITWFMAAHAKGYRLTTEQIAWCLGYVYDLVKCPVYEKIRTNQPGDLRLSDLAPGGRDLVMSILFREAYGGTPGDKSLCRQAASVWAQRWMSCSLHLNRLTRQRVCYITPATDALHLNDWYLAAIDFHCCPAIIQHIREKFDTFTEEQIKLAIWHGSSAITNKENIGVADDTVAKTSAPVWLAIKKVVKAYASYILCKM